ncbi:MAG TPA: hypothetical protein DD670_19425 [Planctomycetaceae bacterium]|nr:hypothetical protein [Planctomycetaceae bacterium]
MFSPRDSQKSSSPPIRPLADRRAFLRRSTAAVAGLGAAAFASTSSLRAEQPGPGSSRRVGLAPGPSVASRQPLSSSPGSVCRLATPRVLTLREQDEVTHRIIEKRLDTVVPLAMREAGIDMWLILCYEDAYDPIHTSMTPMNTWRPILQMLVFFDRGPDQGVERFNISMTNMRGLFEEPWKGRYEKEQWAVLREMIAARDPKRIGIHVGDVQWLAMGLTWSLHQMLREALPEKYAARLESAEPTATRWGATLIDDEIELYKHVVDVASTLISESYSRKAIVPGATTIDDLVWYHSQRVVELGMELAFPPSFYRFRSDAETARFGVDDPLLRPGDFIRCDIGLRYLRLITDQQHWAYILGPGETDAPEPMRRRMAQTHRLQHIFMDEMREGLTGDEMLANMLARAHREGITNPKIYSHSLGIFLHEPGPLIGLPWEQTSNPGRGDVKLRENSAFAMELSTGGPIPEWSANDFRVALEENVVFTQGRCRPISGLQKEFYLV